MAWGAVCSPVWGQSSTVPSSRVSTTSAQVDVPRQLTLEAAEQLLVQQNLAVASAHYGVDNARAQRLVAAVRPNPTLTLGAEGFDVQVLDAIRTQLLQLRQAFYTAVLARANVRCGAGESGADQRDGTLD